MSDKPRALFLPVNDGGFTAALTLASDFPYPKERAGAPVSYWNKQMLAPGVKVFDKSTGKVEMITPERIKQIALDFSRAKANGFEPSIPLGSHDLKSAPNAGWLLNVDVKPDGSLWGLHQFIGNEDRGKELAASYKSSISTITNYTDEHGNTYGELIDHNALVQNPVISSLSDFVPAIAASRGQAIEAVSLELAAPPQQEIPMDLSKLRTKVGAAADLPDQKVIELVETKLAELDAAAQEKLTLSRDLANANGMIADLKKPAGAAKPSAEQLHYLGKTLSLSRDEAAKAIGSHAVTEASKRFLGSELYDVGALTLSRDSSDADAKTAEGLRRFIDFCELAKLAKVPARLGEKTGQAIAASRPDPDGASDEDAAQSGFAQGEAYRKQQLEARGIKV